MERGFTYNQIASFDGKIIFFHEFWGKTAFFFQALALIGLERTYFNKPIWKPWI